MKENKTEEELSRERYGALIDRKRPISKAHPPRPLSVRAAIFAPFAALSGFEEELKEQELRTEGERELMEDERARLNELLRILCDRIECRPLVRVRYFVPDAKKSGGAYRVREGRLSRIDRVRGELVFEDRAKIALSRIVDIEI